MSKNGEIYTAGKNFTLPPGLTGWTNSTSVPMIHVIDQVIYLMGCMSLLCCVKVSLSLGA